MMQGGPLMHAIAAKAIAFFEAMQPEFTTYQKAVLENAKFWPLSFSSMVYVWSPAAPIIILSSLTLPQPE